MSSNNDDNDDEDEEDEDDEDDGGGNQNSEETEGEEEEDEDDDIDGDTYQPEDNQDDDDQEEENSLYNKKRNIRRTRSGDKNRNVNKNTNKSVESKQQKKPKPKPKSGATSTKPMNKNTNGKTTTHKRRKRFKLRITGKSKQKTQKNKFKVDCPYCQTSNTLQIVGTQQFKLKPTNCIQCKEEFWTHIDPKDDTPIITKNYPFAPSTHPTISAAVSLVNNYNTNKLQISFNRKRKKREDSFDEDDKDESSSDIEVLNDKPIKSTSKKPIIASPPRKKRKKNNMSTNNNTSTNQDNKMNNKIDVTSDGDDNNEMIFRFDDVIKKQNEKDIDKQDNDDYNDINYNNDNVYFDSNTGKRYLIPMDDEYDNNVLYDDNDGYNEMNNYNKIEYNAYNRPYQAKMSHIEMVEPCSRSNCSDFLSGNTHCWQASPMMLPGNIRMAQIGYIYQCCWCSKEICFVEECQSRQQLKYSQSEEIVDAILIDKDKDKDKDKDEDEDKSNNNNNIEFDNIAPIEQQSRVIFSTLLQKWKSSESIPNFSQDGPSYSRVPFSLNDLRIKDRIMASDGTNWLPGWIEKIEKNKKSNINNRVLIHFKGWNSRWDRFYHINSGSLKTVNEYRKEKKLHSATRNEVIYEIMKHKYPNFISTTLFEQEINKKYKNRKKIKDKEEMDAYSDDDNNDDDDNKDNDELSEIIDGELVMMHDKNEIYMAVQEIGIHEQDSFILNPPLFFSTSSIESNTDKNITELVRKCFIHLNNVLNNDDDIKLIYQVCDKKIDRVFFALHCLKRPERVQTYLKLLRYNNNNKNHNK